jgi:hypothetical protein
VNSQPFSFNSSVAFFEDRDPDVIIRHMDNLYGFPDKSVSAIYARKGYTYTYIYIYIYTYVYVNMYIYLNVFVKILH